MTEQTDWQPISDAEPDAWGNEGEQETCMACGGSGKEWGETCLTCGGLGWTRHPKKDDPDE